MSWARRFLLYLLSLLLFASLLGTAFSTSSKVAFAHPGKVESWLGQSNLYQHFVSETVTQAKKTAGSTEAQGSVTLGDAAVQQAANSAFTTTLFQRSVDTFVDSNYAWLEGKTATPTFTIDLTGAKQIFASQVGQYVKDHIASLPVCTAQQLVEIGSASNVDPLNITCRPPTLDPQAEASLVSQKIENSGDFLANPVISANNINPNGGSSSQPYYQRFSRAPQIYQMAVKLPWVYAIITLVCALGMVFVARRKRSGLWRIGIVLTLAGLVLVAVRIVADPALHHLEKHVFNNASVGQLQQALTNFLNLAEQQVVKVDLWFAIGFLLLALIIFLALKITHNRAPKARPPRPPEVNDDGSLANRLKEDLPPQPPEMPRPPKRPRLIQ